MAARSWNRIELMGNLTRDPELRFTPNGAAVCTFGIATNRSYVTDGERREEVDFHRLVAWNKLAELCNQLLKKGNRVFISGRLQYREWEAQDGQKKRDAEIVIEDMILLTAKDAATGSTGEDVAPDEFTQSEPAPKAAPAATPKKEEAEEKPKAAPATETISDDDLPF